MKSPKSPAKKKKSVIVPKQVVTIDRLDNAAKIASLQLVVQTPGWALIKQVLQENMDYLGRLLIRGADPDTGEKLTEDEQKDARRKYELTEALMKTPEGYIAALERAEANKPVDYDPYFANNADIMSATQ